MERPLKINYANNADFEAAKEEYRIFMVDHFRNLLASGPVGDELVIVKRRLHYWENQRKCCEATMRCVQKKLAEDPDYYKKKYTYSRANRREKAKEYRVKHHDAILKREAEKREANREVLNARARDYRSRHLEECRERCRKYHDAHRKPVVPVTCPICGKEFIKHNGEQKYCSKDCFRENRRAYSRKLYGDRTEEQKEHYRLYARRYAKSEKAKKRMAEYEKSEAGIASRKKARESYKHTEKGIASRKRYESTETYKVARHRHDIRRRARKAKNDLKAVDAGIHWKTLARRLGSMRCAMCGIECDPEGEPSVRPTVDHIIPVSKGGTHTWDNVQLLCMRCNSGKCAKLPEELV